MESSLREIFERMESRLGEILDQMEERLIEIIAAVEDKRPAESVSFTTESAADEHFDEFDDLDKGPVFDANHVAVSVFEFVRLKYDAELTVFDTDSDSLDDLPVFDTEPVHDAAPASDYAAFTALKFAIHNPATTDLDVDLSSFDIKPGGRSHVHTGVVVDDGPLFDEEPAQLASATRFVLDSNRNAPLTCSRKLLNILVNTALVRRYHQDATKEMIILGSMQVPGSAVFSARVADDGFEHRFWDPGSSKFTRISLCFAPAQHHEFLVAGFEH
jgi:hypothetical protein